jgi:hypothetical protein
MWMLSVKFLPKRECFDETVRGVGSMSNKEVCLPFNVS